MTKDATVKAAIITAIATLLAAVLIVVLPILIRGEDKAPTALNSPEINGSHIEIKAGPGSDQHAVVGTSVNNSYITLVQSEVGSGNSRSTTVAPPPVRNATKKANGRARQKACTQKQDPTIAEALDQLHKPIPKDVLEELHRR